MMKEKTKKDVPSDERLIEDDCASDTIRNLDTLDLAKERANAKMSKRKFDDNFAKSISRNNLEKQFEKHTPEEQEAILISLDGLRKAQLHMAASSNQPRRKSSRTQYSGACESSALRTIFAVELINSLLSTLSIDDGYLPKTGINSFGDLQALVTKKFSVEMKPAEADAVDSTQLKGVADGKKSANSIPNVDEVSAIQRIKSNNDIWEKFASESGKKFIPLGKKSLDEIKEHIRKSELARAQLKHSLVGHTLDEQTKILKSLLDEVMQVRAIEAADSIESEGAPDIGQSTDTIGDKSSNKKSSNAADFLGKVQADALTGELDRAKTGKRPINEIEEIVRRRRFAIRHQWEKTLTRLKSKWHECLSTTDVTKKEELISFLDRTEHSIIDAFIKHKERDVLLWLNCLAEVENEEGKKIWRACIQKDRQWIRRMADANSTEKAFETIQSSLYDRVEWFYRRNTKLDNRENIDIKGDIPQSDPVKEPLPEPEKLIVPNERLEILEAIAQALDLTKLRTDRVIDNIKVGGMTLALRLTLFDLEAELESLVKAKTPPRNIDYPNGEFYNQRKDKHEGAVAFFYRVYGRFYTAKILYKHQLRAMDKWLLDSLYHVADAPELPTKKQLIDKILKDERKSTQELARLAFASSYRE